MSQDRYLSDMDELRHLTDDIHWLIHNRGRVQDPGRLTLSSHPNSVAPSEKGALKTEVDTPTFTSPHSSNVNKRRQDRDIAMIPPHIFIENLRPPAIELKLPEADERLSNTPQLACCLGLLQTSPSWDSMLEPAARSWLQGIEKDIEEQKRLKLLASEVVRAYKRDEFKDAKTVAEVACLAPVLDKDAFRDLLREFYSGIDHSGLLSFHQLEGLAQLIQGTDAGYLDADDLVKILDLLSARLRETHQQSQHHIYRLTLTVSHVLDAMADTQVKDLDREKLHAPLSSYLNELKSSSDPYLVFQAAYAYQALLCVPDNESLWQATMRRTGKVIQGVAGLVSGVKGLDLNKFLEGLGDIQQGFAGMSDVATVVKTAYEGVISLNQSGQEFMDCLKEGLSFQRKRDWYSALRGADILIRDGELATFRKLVCEAPCRRDAAFQWGVCQRLGDIAANPAWDANTRQSAITFLGEIYVNDGTWGQQASVKQWILNILIQLASASGAGLQCAFNCWANHRCIHKPYHNGSTNYYGFTLNDVYVIVAEILLRDLESSGDTKKQALYRTCRVKGSVSHPLKVVQVELASPSLLDRVQNRPDVEGSLRLLKKQRTKERGHAVYIQPQAKANLQAPDHARFPLMEKVKEFLSSHHKVFLLLGDSGAGKSTFSRELECELWQTYKNKSGRIPLHINLPAIDKPEHDLIAKQLRKAEFTEPQIREMKHYRKFILICDGYDESQQTHNLYTTNKLNQPGEWDAQMIISCRSEYLGVDYRDRFQPGDRNQQSDSTLFQAVITPFSLDMVHAYIHQYVVLHQPLWQTEDYKRALELIPSLKDLVKNPFLMTLSLEVLPRMVDSEQHLSGTRITRVALYDQFVEQWLERGKKRLGEKDLSPQARAAFESLSDEGFTQNGIHFLKSLAMAIYKKQGGQPVVEYSRFKDEGSWKDTFFSREDEKQLLREACPLTRSGNQHRFIHRSLLEYGLARAVFDPHDTKAKMTPESVLTRRGSVISTLSFEIHGLEEETTVEEYVPDLDSPLAWRSFVNEHSLLQFLEERVQQEPIFKEQLLAYIEHSKVDKKYRTAAANAITILVRAGVQFIGADLKGIQIPGADLSFGMFDSAQLQGADLRKANLRGLWLRQADLSSAQMTGVQFGELPFLTEHDAVRSCAYSLDGELFVVGLDNGDIKVYTTSSWERARTLSGHGQLVRGVAFSRTGHRIVSGSDDATVRLWDIETGACLVAFTGHSDNVQSVAYSPHEDLIASASSDKTVRLWDASTGAWLLILTGHGKAVLSAVFSPNGKQIASGSADNTVRLWQVETGACDRTLIGHRNRVWSIAYSSHGDAVASASDDKTIRLWDVESGTCRHILTGHSNFVYGVAYSPKGDQIASAGKDGTGLLWDVESGSSRRTLAGHSGAVMSVAFSPKDGHVASGSLDKTVRLWDIENNSTSRHIASGHNMGVRAVKYSPNGAQVASCSVDNTIRLWDTETGTCRQTLRGHGGTVFGIAYSPYGEQIASCSADLTVRLWDVETGDCRTLSGHSDWVNGVAYSPNGGFVVSCSKDKTMRLWDVRTGDCCQTFLGHTGGILCTAFSPRGHQVASGSLDGTARLWNVETGDCQQVLSGHSDHVWSIAYSPNGDQITSASEDATMRMWDVETGGTCQLVLKDHAESVSSVAYSPRGDLLASGSWDKTVRIWSVESGRCVATISNFLDCIYGLDWLATSDGHCYLATGSRDGSVFMWEIAKGDPYKAHMRWGATNGALAVAGATIRDVQGLSQLNTQLLKQLGALSTPVHTSQ